MATWIARGSWLLVAVVGGAGIDEAAAPRDAALRWTAAIGAWSLWAMVMAALAVPSVRTLTLVRVTAPVSLIAAATAALAGATAVGVALLVVPSAVALAAIFSAGFGRAFVQASAYGDEERLPLRLPVAAGTAAVIAWVLWAMLVVVGPTQLAGGNTVLGVALVGLAIGATVLFAPRWHRLSKRWLVLVPAGLVVHDPVVLADTLMVRTDQIVSIHLAEADTEAADLTGPASGYAIEVQTSTTVTTVFAFTPSEPNGRAIHMTGFLISPSRPGEALRTATARGLPTR